MRSQDNLDKKLRDNTPIPLGLEWDTVAPGIYDKMDTKKPRKRRFLVWILSTVGLLLLFSTISYLGLTDNETVAENTNKESVNKTPTVAESIPVNEYNTSLSDRPADSIENTSNDANIKTSIGSKNISNKRKLNNEFNQTAIENSVAQGATSIKKTYSNSNHKNDLIENLSTSEKIIDNYVTINDISIDQTIESYAILSVLDPIKSDGIIQDFNPVKINLMPASVELLQPNETQTKPWSIAAVSSLVYWDQNYDPNVLLEKQAMEESSITGYHMGIEGAYQINNTWSVFSGLDRSRLYTKYEGTLRTQESVRLTNVVLVTEINPLLSAPIHHSGDTTLVRNFDRFISYHNIVDRWSLPVGLRYHKSYGPIELTAGLGVQLGLYKTGQGITARGTYRLDYDSSSDIYKHGLDIAIRPELGIRYNLTEKVFAGFTFNYQQHIINWSSEQSLVSTPKIFRSGISLGYRL